jgi:ribose transport system ATP-binding protein
MPARLRVIGVSKSFGATRALRNVNFEIAPGEVHALIGENGAGKSTLMKILSGACRPDEGRIELEGQPFVPADPLHARRCGISMIYQELNLAPHLSVEENILLGEEPTRFGWLQRGKRRELARAALGQLRHENIPLDAPVHTRSVAEQQIVEIARALVGRPRVLIMDEPTSSLTQADVENLFRVIGHLRETGVSVIYISHFIEECQRICQRYTILRDGQSVSNGDMASANLRDIVHLMVGREIQDIYPRVPHQPGEPMLQIRDLAGAIKPRAATLVLRKGEILGVSGLIGSGRTETVRVAFGLDRLTRGEVLVYGENKTLAAPSDRLRDGIGLLSENRKEEGLMLNLSISDNLTLTRLQPLASCGFIGTRRQERASSAWMTRLDVRARGPAQAVSELSGGNQQKIALGRLLHHDAKILLLDEPTRGIDVGSKAQIYRWMGQLAAEGRAILFISSYLPELLGVCDTIAVMCRGTITQVRPASEWTEHSIMAAAIGQS